MQKKEQKARASSPLQELKQKVNELSTVYEKLSVGYDWLKSFHRNVFTYLALLAGFVWFLLGRIETRLDSRIDKMEANTKQDIQEIRQLLIQLIQKQTPPPAPASGKQTGIQ